MTSKLVISSILFVGFIFLCTLGCEQNGIFDPAPDNSIAAVTPDSNTITTPADSADSTASMVLVKKGKKASAKLRWTDLVQMDLVPAVITDDGTIYTYPLTAAPGYRGGK